MKSLVHSAIDGVFIMLIVGGYWILLTLVLDARLFRTALWGVWGIFNQTMGLL